MASNDGVEALNRLAQTSKFCDRYRTFMMILILVTVLIAILGAFGVFGSSGCHAPSYEVNGACVAPHTVSP